MVTIYQYLHVADVVAIFLWLMLLPLLMLADVVAMFGWCCCHYVADVIATF